MTSVMKKSFIIILLITILSVLYLAYTDISYADEKKAGFSVSEINPQKAEAKKGNESFKKPAIKLNTAWDDDEFIGINSPAYGEIFYGSDTMYLDTVCYDTWQEYYTRAGFAVFDEDDEIVLDFDGDAVVPKDEGLNYIGDIDISSLSPGVYYLDAWAIPCDEDGTFVEDWGSWSNVPCVEVQFSIADTLQPISGSKYISIKNPKKGMILYRNSKKIEPLPVKVLGYDSWRLSYTLMGFGIYNSKGKAIKDFDDSVVIGVDSSRTYSKKINLGKVANGTYELDAWAIPCYASRNYVSGWGDWYNVPEASVKFKIAQLKAPSGLKLTAGKKKVTVTYKKAKGAQKYQIYRSTKKSSGYKKIKTTTKTKYVDKKVKRGKSYYYKVRSLRTSGVASKYTSPKRSKKVK